MPTKLVVNCETNESLEVEMTKEEIEALEAMKTEAEELEAQRLAEAEALLAAKQSAQDKLKGLGLSDIEIAAITGA